MLRLRSPLVALLSLTLLSCPAAQPPSAAAVVVVVPPELPVAPPRPTRMDADHAAALAANPVGVHYEIRFAGGRSRFVQGEPIRIEHSFSSSLPATYVVDGVYHDRSRLDIDEHLVEPDVVVDLLAGSADDGIGHTIGTLEVPLGDKPVTLTQDLNEWKRFDQPGHYRLYVRSARVHWDGQGDRTTHRVTSNLLEFDVVRAPPEYSARVLAAAVALLDGGVQEDQIRGARALRFLGTEAAALELVRRLRGDERFDYECEFGLIASPHRAAIVQAMEARLDDESPVTHRFVRTLATLRIRLDQPGPLDEARRAAVTDAYTARLAAALPRKPPASRAVCVATVLALGLRSGEALPPWIAGALALVPSVFRDLPEEEMWDLLEWRWARIKSPAMLPILRAVHDDPATTPRLRLAVLKRLVDIDPPGARKRLLAHLRTGEPPLGTLDRETLAALPDATLPELDAPLVRRFERFPDRDVLALIARYATAAPLRAIKASFAREQQQGHSGFTGHYLAYFLRVDPAFGERIARALLAGGRAEQVGALDVAASYRMTRGLEQVLIAALDARDGLVVAMAAETLGPHGSAAAAPALWKRLERFHTEWKDRERELRRSIVDPQHNADARWTEEALRVALATNKSWLCDKACFERLDSLLVTDEAKRNARYRARALDEPIRILASHMDGGELHTGVAQYDFESFPELEAKLAQFPRGTAFRWGGNQDGDLPAVKRTLDRLGMTLVR